jgi:hypothetical protein
LFEENGFCDYRTDAAGSPKPANGNEDIDEKDNEIAHANILPRTPRA